MGELAEPWNTAAEKVGVRQTYRGIGEAAGVSHMAVKRLIEEGRTSPATVAKVSAALRVEESRIYQWAQIDVSDWGPWTPPKEAHRLNPRARAALAELIRAVTVDQEVSNAGRSPKDQKSSEQQEPGRQEGGSDDGQSDAQKSPAGGGVTSIHDRRRQKLIDQAQPAEEAAYDLPLDLPPEEEDVSQDPDDWPDDPS